MELKNVSPNRPAGLIIDVSEKDADEILKTGEFVKNIKENLVVMKKSESKPVKKKVVFEEEN